MRRKFAGFVTARSSMPFHSRDAWPWAGLGAMLICSVGMLQDRRDQYPDARLEAAAYRNPLAAPGVWTPLKVCPAAMRLGISFGGSPGGIGTRVGLDTRPIV